MFKSLLYFCFFWLTLLPASLKAAHAAADSAEIKIVYFGSSVARGEGAQEQKGYTHIFSQRLRSYPSSHRWKPENISIGGDNTIKLLARYEKDLLPLKGKYVVFALALGNEGIHEHGAEKFEQFKTNMQLLLEKARADGYTPIVTNSYGRNDYTDADYAFIRQMNLLIHRWAVPSINLLGATDDLSGHWAEGYWADGFHPNDAGHAEMAYSLPPSMFEALEQSKPLPRRLNGSYLELGSRKTPNTITFSPEQTLHAFTVSLSFNTGKPGSLLELQSTGGRAEISINPNGKLVYSSAGGAQVESAVRPASGKWHELTLTHYYAAGVTLLYCDGQLQGEITEKVQTLKVSIGGPRAPEKLRVKDWLFYRAGMNAEEVQQLGEGKLLKSSLELYAPLDGRGKSVSDPYVNLAQSMNTLSLSAGQY